MAGKTVTMPSPTSRKIDGIDKWEVEEAARTLIRAFEIQATPKLFDAAMKVVNAKASAAKKTADWGAKLGSSK